jgi:hypothetical protein
VVVVSELLHYVGRPVERVRFECDRRSRACVGTHRRGIPVLAHCLDGEGAVDRTVSSCAGVIERDVGISGRVTGCDNSNPLNS